MTDDNIRRPALGVAELALRLPGPLGAVRDSDAPAHSVVARRSRYYSGYIMKPVSGPGPGEPPEA